MLSQRKPIVSRVLNTLASIPFAERLIYYIFLPDLFSRIFLEFGAGIYWYSITQPKQWVLYLIFMVEYAIASLTLMNKRFSFRENAPPLILFLCMAAHGLIAGVIWFNGTAKLLTDSIPVIVVLVNMVLLSERDAYKGLSFDRIYAFARVYSVLMITFGILAVKMGKPSIISLGGAGGTPLCLSLLILGAAKSSQKQFFWNFVILLFVMTAVVPNITRTTLLVAGGALAILVLPRVFKSLMGIAASIAILAGLLIVGPIVVPDDSPLARRIYGIFEGSSTSSSEGSLGERQAEVDAINSKLRLEGPSAEWFGAGAGGTYQVEFTNGKIPENYSHAHYGWALFKLRYGYVGYLYLTIFVIILCSRAAKYCMRRDSFGQLVGVMCVWGVVFVFTYMYFNQLIAGLQFCIPPLLAAGNKVNPLVKNGARLRTA